MGPRDEVEDLGIEPFEQTGESLLGDAPGLTAASVASAPAERPAAPLALYRRYRPDTFADVIGQEHVTDPLRRALTNNRVNHAYLFSGPRGCGKTTSARILARCLNCEQGPTPEPCGVCDSCRDLARGGPGSIDVIEMDAASHGGVDDARDLRERAFFSPVHSRYKIYIVDEAHMVTTQGFNALLKLVEEPPPHVKFVFATTEPDKVIGTIRSRTHHYPFRLVPPKTLQTYLARLCEAEGIAVDSSVLPLVVRAGAGSVRDSLSVLDQLLGGAAEAGVSYAQAASLLGYTPDSLLDEIVDAFAAGDAAGVFACVDKVMEVGQDPRRFGEDLLRRLRDLLIIAAVPDALTSGLVEASEDQAERLHSQSAALGAGELTRAAEILATGLTEMRGTTAPRLHLELMCARVLLPGADVDDRGIHARLDRLERRLAGVPLERSTLLVPAPVQPVPTASAPSPAPPAAEPATHTPETTESRPTSVAPPPPPPTPPAAAAAAAPAPAAADRAGAGLGLTVSDVRRLWPDVLDLVKRRRRYTWMVLSQNAQVSEVRDGVLTLAMKNAGVREGFSRGGNEDILRDAIVEVLRADLRIQTIIDGAGSPDRLGSPTPASASAAPIAAAPPPTQSASPTQSPAAAAAAPPLTQSAPLTPSPEPAQSPSTTQSPPPRQPPPRSAAPSPAAPSGPAADPGVPSEPSAAALARDQIRPTRGPALQEPPPEDEPDFEAYTDLTEEGEELPAHELLTRHLGAELIAEEQSPSA